MAEADRPDGAERAQVKVSDRRRFSADGEPVAPVEEETAPPEPPGDPETTAIRERAETAERKLRDFQEAYRAWREEQDQVRARLEGSVERRAEIRFGDLAVEVLAVVDDLDLAVEHARGVEAAEPLARGVAMARERFLAALLRLGVERLEVDGAEFDPELAEAVAVVPTDDATMNNTVAKTLQPGYRLGDRVIRPARVLVARSAG